MTEIYRGSEGSLVEMWERLVYFRLHGTGAGLLESDALGAAWAVLRHFDEVKETDVSFATEIREKDARIRELEAENAELRQAHFKKDARIREVEAGLDRLTRIIDAYRLVIGDMVAYPSKTGAP